MTIHIGLDYLCALIALMLAFVLFVVVSVLPMATNSTKAYMLYAVILLLVWYGLFEIARKIAEAI